MNTLMDALRARAETLNPLFDPPSARIEGGRLVLDHVMLTWTSHASLGIVDALGVEGLPTPEATAEYEAALHDVARRQERLALHMALSDGSPADEAWTDFDRPPAWALLTHPLMAYAMRTHGMHDMDADRMAEGPHPVGSGVRCVQDLIVGRLPLEPSNDVAIVACDDMGAVLQIRATIPESTRHMLRGRTIASLLGLRPCGDARIDALANGLTILHVDQFEGEDVATVMIVPSPWITPSAAPLGIDMKPIVAKAPFR